jgi:undecaprenyl-diphosphatase
VVYLTLGALLARSESSKRFKLFFMSVAVLLSIPVGLSRIYLMAHYHTDVPAGWIAGAVWALVCLLTAGFLQQRSEKEK